ncbi:MAG: ATP-binding protein, partial [Methylophaga sp.]
MVIITEANPVEEPGPKIVFVNAAFERITGYSRVEAIGRSPRFLQGPKTQRHELDKIRTALLSQQPVRVQLTNYHKDGSEFEIELSIVPIGMESGRVTHLVAIEREITAEKNLQKQLQLAQRMEAIGQLTGGIAHDFNNLLTVITGNNDILQDALQDQPKLLSLSNLIGHAAERGAGLTRNLLAFARRQPLSPVNVDVNQLILQLQDLLRSSLTQKYQLRVALNEDLWPVMIDPVQMESSLLNMTINARDAMAEGGQLIISTENIAGKSIDYDIDINSGDWVKISVCDTGNGIADNMLDKIFEPFFTTKAAGNGSGLGLSMVFGFIKQSGGHIRVISETGEGTCFHLYLPRVTQTANAPAEVATP